MVKMVESRLDPRKIYRAQSMQEYCLRYPACEKAHEHVGNIVLVGGLRGTVDAERGV